MNRNVPEHINLYHKPTFNWEDSGKYHIEVTIFKKKESFFSIYIVVNPPQEYASLLKDQNKREFGIPCDCKIILKLDTSNGNDKNWRFSQNRSVITTKEYLKPLYGGIKVKNAWEVSFYAKYNEMEDPYSHAALHEFNINIEIKQEDGEWLPVTIDPDIRNPRPDNRKSAEGVSGENEYISTFALKGSV